MSQENKIKLETLRSIREQVEQLRTTLETEARQPGYTHIKDLVDGTIEGVSAALTIIDVNIGALTGDLSLLKQLMERYGAQ